MIQFFSDSLSSLSLMQPWGWDSSANHARVQFATYDSPSFAVCIPTSYIGSAWTYLTRPTKSSLNTDYLFTGKTGFMGDHACFHSKVEGFVLPNSSGWTTYAPAPFWGYQSTDSSESSYESQEVVSNITGPGSKAGSLYLIPDYMTQYNYCIRGSSDSETHPKTRSTKWTSKTYAEYLPIGRGTNYISYAVLTIAIDYAFRCNDGRWYPILENKKANIVYVCQQYSRGVMSNYYFHSDDITVSYDLVKIRYLDNWVNTWASYKPSNPHFKSLSWDTCCDITSGPLRKDMMAAIGILGKSGRNSTLWQDLLLGRPTAHSGTMTLVSQANMTYKAITLGSARPSAEALEAVLALKSKAKKLLDESYQPSLDELGDCAQGCADNCHDLNINSISYCRDLLNAKKEILQLRDLLVDARSAIVNKNPSAIPKILADLGLSYQYGARLTIADTKELVKAVDNAVKSSHYTGHNGFFASRATGRQQVQRPELQLQPGHRTIHYKLYYRAYPNNFIAGLQKLNDWDVWPTLGNLWDLVPFSFVVDWFISIGDLFDAMDDNNYLSLLDVGGVVWSAKDEFSLGSYPLTADTTLTSGGIRCYQRHLGSSAHIIPSHLSLLGKFNQHYLEGLALVVQHF